MKQGGGSETFLRNVFENILMTYLRKNPMAKTIWELVQSVDNEKVCYDHFTFQTFKVRMFVTLVKICGYSMFHTSTMDQAMNVLFC